MSTGGGQQTTSTQTSTPWTEAQPFLKEALKGAQTAYQSGGGFDYFPGSTVVPFSPQTQSAMAGIEQQANAGNPLGIASRDQALGILNSGGMSDWQRGALGGTYDIATGAKSIGTEGDLRGLLSESSNPYYEGVVNREAGKLGDDINRSFSNAGRYGSGAHTGVLSDELGAFRERAMSNKWDQNIANQRGLLSDITGVQGANIANMAGAGGQINAAGNQAAGNVAQFAGLAPGIYNQQYAPYERLASVGSQQEDLSTREMQDAINRFNTEQQTPWNSLAAYNALIGGAGQLGGTTTMQVPKPSGLQTGLAGALGGAQMGSAFGLPGMLVGGGLGGLLGMF